MMYVFFKRVLDILASTLGLLVLSPLLLLIAVLIVSSSGGPIFYLGERVGLDKKIFKIFKFRTMVKNAEIRGDFVTSKDDYRITRIGKALRKYKLDELPQLLNVFFGEMSLVGPRPEVHKFTSLYSKKQEIIFTVKPGLTDFSSIEFIQLGEVLGTDANKKKFEDNIDKVLNKKIELRMNYVNQKSFFTDIKILLMTVKKILLSIR